MTKSSIDTRSKAGNTRQDKISLPSTTKRAAADITDAQYGKSPSVKRTVKSTGKKSRTEITPEQRQQMIAVAAYYRAEKRGFQCRCSERDWYEATAEIDRIL